MPPITTFQFDSKQPGTRLLIFGAIHGNEPCGPAAIARVMETIKNGSTPLVRGSVRFVPVCNKPAFDANKRLIEENLNRVFRKDSSARSSEAHIANELCEMMDEHADAFLDVHSATAPGPTSVFIDYPSPENEAFANALGLEYALFGWPAVYEKNPHGFDSFDTTRYAHDIGIPGVIVECGQHGDPAAVDTAEKVILRALAHYEIISRPTEIFPSLKKIVMKTLEKKNTAGDSFTNKWEHLEPVKKGTVIAKRESGENIVASTDSIILLPKHHAVPGEEWFYLGEQAL
jgi:predicted deacylase